MNVSQSALGLMLLAAVAVGGALGLLYDVYRGACGLLGLENGSETPASHPGWCVMARILVTALDVLFGLTCGVALILLLYYANDGQFRASAAVCMGVGYWLYRMSLGRVVTRLVSMAVSLLRRVAAGVMRRLVHPLVCLGARAVHRMRDRRIQAREARRKRRGVAYTQGQMALDIRRASEGFGLAGQDEKNQ